MILVDYSGIAMAVLFTQASQQVDEGLLRHMILNSLRVYNKKYRDEYGQMIICCDGGAKWRKEIFAEYKANRAKGREESKIDWDEFFRIMNLIKEEIREYFPWHVLHVMGCEADDIIATMVNRAQEFGIAEKVMIVSSDHDFQQLQKFANVSQYSPSTKKLVKCKDPIRYLREHILRGDAGDGVPNCLSHGRTFVDGDRQKQLRAKRVEEMLDNWDNLNLVVSQEVISQIHRNQAMVDLSKIPEAITSEILDSYEASNPKRGRLLSYFVKHKLGQLTGSAPDFQNKAS